MNRLIDPFGEHALIPWGLQYPHLWDGCVSAWYMGAGPSGGTLYDFSPYANHGSLAALDPETDWVISNGHYAINFTGSISQTIPMTRAGVLQGESAATVSLWCYPTTISGSLGNSMFAQSYDSSSFSVSVRQQGGVAVASFRDGTPGTTATATGATSLSANNLYHIAATFTRTSQQIFLNGKLDGSSSTSMGVITPTAFATAIGYANAREYFGDILEVMVHRRRLSEVEINTLSLRPGIAYQARSRQTFFAPEVVGGGTAVPVFAHHYRTLARA